MKTRKRQLVGIAAILAVLLSLAGCGGGGGEGEEPTANRSPRANAGEDQTVATGSRVTLDGSGSSDADGAIAAYQWAQTSGTGVSLSNTDQAAVSFMAPQADMTVTLIFRLTVTDSDGATASDDVSVTVQPAESGDAFVLDRSELDDPAFRLQ